MICRYCGEPIEMGEVKWTRHRNNIAKRYHLRCYHLLIEEEAAEETPEEREASEQEDERLDQWLEQGYNSYFFPGRIPAFT